MGKLLDLGIQASQKTSVAPTLNVFLSFFDGESGTTQIFKNSILYATLSTNTSTVAVPLVNGDTYRILTTSTNYAEINGTINSSSFLYNGIPSADTGTQTALSNQVITANTICSLP